MVVIDIKDQREEVLKAMEEANIIPDLRMEKVLVLRKNSKNNFQFSSGKILLEKIQFLLLVVMCVYLSVVFSVFIKNP